MVRIISLRLAASCVLAFSTPSFGAVIVVDSQGQPGFPVLTAAVQSAADGDILLLQAGDYTSLTGSIDVIGKGLTLINDTSGSLLVAPLSIESVPSGSSVLVRGLTVEATLLKPAVKLANNAGPIWLEDCVLTGATGNDQFIPLAPTEALTAIQCDTVALLRCTLIGGPGYDPVFSTFSADGAPGATVSESRFFVYDSELRGGTTGVGFPENPVVGPSTGLILSASEALLAGSEVRAGGSTNPNGVWGLFATEGSKVFLRDTEVTPVPPAADVVMSASTATDLSTPTLSMHVDSPVVSGQNARIELAGRPGSQVVLLIGTFAPAAFFPTPYQGALLLGPPLVGPIPLGTLPASGTLTITVTTVPLPASVQGVAVPLQAAVLTPELLLEAPASYVQI